MTRDELKKKAKALDKVWKAGKAKAENLWSRIKKMKPEKKEDTDSKPAEKPPKPAKSKKGKTEEDEDMGEGMEDDDETMDDDEGRDDDEEEPAHEYKDGIQWQVSRGSPPSISALEAKLADVKALYKLKTGRDVDSESDDDAEDKQAQAQSSTPGVYNLLQNMVRQFHGFGGDSMSGNKKQERDGCSCSVA